MPSSCPYPELSLHFSRVFPSRPTAHGPRKPVTVTVIPYRLPQNASPMFNIPGQLLGVLQGGQGPNQNQHPTSDPPPNGPLNPKARGPCGRDPSTEIFSTTQLGLIMRAGPPWWRPGRRIGSGPPSLAPTRAVEGATTFQVQSNPRAICSTAGVEIGNFVVVSNASRRGLFAAALGHIHQARSGRVRDRSVLLP